MFAFAQAFLHLFDDYDNIRLSLDKPEIPKPAIENPPSPLTALKTQLVKEVEPLRPLFQYDAGKPLTSLTHNVVLRTASISLLAPFLYAIFVRRTAWQWSLSFAALVWDIPPSQLSYIPPHYPSLVYRSLTSGLCLVFLFEASNAIFTAYVAREPLKRGKLFTAESKDPNGTLLTGLKAKKSVPKVVFRLICSVTKLT